MATKKAAVEGNGTNLYAVKVRGHAVDKDGKIVMQTGDDGLQTPKLKTLATSVMPGEDASVVLDALTADLEERPDVAARVTEVSIKQQAANTIKWG